MGKRQSKHNEGSTSGIWYRHSGEADINSIPDSSECKFKSFKRKNLLKDIGQHHITDMYIYGTEIPPLKQIAPKLTALKIEYSFEQFGRLNPTEIACLNSMVELKELYVTYIDFAAGLPHIITELPMLEKLELRSCRLYDLPQSLSSLVSLKRLNLSWNRNFSHDAAPEVIGELTSLTDLDISQCNLRHLPASLDSLVNLQMLNLSRNVFSNSVALEVIGKLKSLKELKLSTCELQNLPKSFENLKLLERLDLRWNDFKLFPSMLCKLGNLRQIELHGNDQMQSLDIGIASMKHLETLEIEKCPNIRVPPRNVCRQGLPAIKQYYRDLSKGKGKCLPAATVTVIGTSKSGKTSLIRTLQSNKRVLTGDSNKIADVSTKVFNFEEVEVGNTKLRFIDLGGQEIYHMAYRLTLQENCVPVIVVNMEMYESLSKEIGGREAVRQLFFDWMAHLYLAQPDLPAPKLVITHKDKFSSQSFSEMLKQFLDHCTSVKAAIISGEDLLKRENFNQIRSFAEHVHLFQEENIFLFGTKDEDDTLQRCKSQLLKHCESHEMVVPKVWEDVEDSIKALRHGFSTVDALRTKMKEVHDVEDKQLETILTYLHYSGKLLWYKDEAALSHCVFHKISAVIDLLKVFYNHKESAQWDRRLEDFNESRIQSSDFHIEQYEQCVQQFKETGIMNWILMAYLINTETEFKSDEQLDVALAMLHTFRLAFGPLKCDGKISYVLPHFALGYFSSPVSTPPDIELHAHLVFKGLSLPQHVYHEMTVGLLMLLQSQYNAPEVRHNGVLVEDDRSTVSLIHDAKAGKAEIRVLGPIEQIHKSWLQLIMCVNSTIEHVTKAWNAARFECMFYCAHCKLKGSDHPTKIVRPSWCVLSKSATKSMEAKIPLVKCDGEKIPSAFLHPCGPLSEADNKSLKGYVEKFKLKNRGHTQRDILSARKAEEPMSILAVSASDQLLEDVTKLLKDTSLRPTPTTDDGIKALYHNTDQVYKMTPTRGLALIINNDRFDNAADGARDGSDIDMRHIVRMLDDFGFELRPRINLTAEEMLSAIDAIVKDRDKEHEDYGMFVLVIMSHGCVNDSIYGTDGKVISLNEVYRLLAAENFPAMSGKPKLVIVQACGGGLRDFGEQVQHFSGAASPHPTNELSKVSVPPTQGASGGVVVHLKDGAEINHLNTDDLIVIKASFNTYASLRHEKLGSPFISSLVSNFYQHACHKDVRTLCERVQHDVREYSIKLAKKHPEHCFGQAPFYFSMLTKYRKLYLFPGYNGE